MNDIQTLGDALPKEQERVRKLVQMYRDPLLNGAGEIAARMMEQSLKEAELAVMSGDLRKMIVAYQDLKEYTE